MPSGLASLYAQIKSAKSAIWFSVSLKVNSWVRTRINAISGAGGHKSDVATEAVQIRSAVSVF